MKNSEHLGKRLDLLEIKFENGENSSDQSAPVFFGLADLRG